MYTEFIKTKEEYKEILLHVRDMVISEVGSDKVNVTLGDQYRLKNTPLYLVLEFHVDGHQNNDDYGPCLAVAYQHYNPTLQNLVVDTNSLFVTADLSRVTGEFISDFELIQLDLKSKNIETEWENTFEHVKGYLLKQVPLIVDTLRHRY
jgi:hypothetical protein